MTIFIKTTLKDLRKIRRIRNYVSKWIYICISWYSKICWFPEKKCWCQQNPSCVSCDSYSFWNFFRYKSANFHHCRICVTDFREGGGFLALPIREQPQKSPTWIGLKQKSNIAILKCQISRFSSKFVSLKQLSWQQTNYHFVTFSHMYDKISSCKKFKKIRWVDPEKMHHRHKDGQMDRWTGLIS